MKCVLYALLEFGENVPEECAEWLKEEALLERWKLYEAGVRAEV